MFSTSIPALSYVMLAIAFSGLLAACLYGLQAYFRASRLKPQPDPEEGSEFPKASIIIYADCSEELLDRTIDRIVKEDYPDFEIIVVCDSLVEEANILNERYGSKYNNVYVTFIPPGSHNLSRRKLAITSGVKASTGEIIVTTVGNIEIPENHKWLRSLLSPFCGYQGKYVDISLGLSVINPADLTGYGRWYRRFDSVLSNALWIGYAANGNPYRGDGNNLAFRKSVFLEHKGYAKTINLHNGDDDLFISEIANSSNTRVVISEDSILTTVWPNGANKIWSQRKESYNFTARWLRKSPFIRDWTNNALQWIVPAAALTGFITALPNLIGFIIGVSIILIFWALEILLYMAVAKKVKGEAVWYQVIPFWFYRIIEEVVFRLLHYKRSKKNFTWVR